MTRYYFDERLEKAGAWRGKHKLPLIDRKLSLNWEIVGWVNIIEVDIFWQIT